jgi:carboxylesterase type B
MLTLATNELPWPRPEPAEWNTTNFAAVQYGFTYMQRVIFTARDSIGEDCLSVNVQVPAGYTADSLPFR